MEIAAGSYWGNPEAKAICERAISEKLHGQMIHRILYEVADAENDDRAMQRQAECSRTNR
jgi:hypothetical protein